MKKYLIILIIGLSFCLNLYGVWWAGPDEERLKLVFGGDKELVKTLTPEMAESWGELYEGIHYHHQPRGYKERNITVLMKNGKSVIINRSLLDSIRSYLLRSYAPDEQITLKSLSNMNPSKLDFNPNYYLWGGLFFYLLAIFFMILSKIGVIILNSDITYYFFHPNQIGMLFTIGKIYL